MKAKTVKKKTTKQKRKPVGCDCLAQANEQLRKTHGAKFKRELRINFETGEATLDGPFLVIESATETKRKRLPLAMCAYCPFCGKKKP